MSSATLNMTSPKALAMRTILPRRRQRVAEPGDEDAGRERRRRGHEERSRGWGKRRGGVWGEGKKKKTRCDVSDWERARTS